MSEPGPHRPRRPLLGIGLVAALVALPLRLAPDGHEHAQTVQFIGRFHPMVVHVPIALLLLVPVLEYAGSRSRQRRHLHAAAGFVLGIAAAGTFVAAFLGCLLAWSGGYEGRLVTQHLWGGVSLAAGCLVCCSLRGRDRRLYPIALAATLGLLVWTGHQGNGLTRGENYLTKYMPPILRRAGGLRPVAPGIRQDSAGSKLALFDARIVPIFEDNCITCHGPEKHKGGLRLDSYAGLMHGGKDGVVIKPGDLKGSELFRRISLPSTDEHAMPPEGKLPLRAEELKVIELWIVAGASETRPVSAFAELPAARVREVTVALAPDYRAKLAEIAALERKLGVRLVPRSQISTDGLTLRTISSPGHCDDSTIAQLRPIADLIVDAELARTKITDAGLAILAAWPNLRMLDLSHTAISSAGIGVLVRAKRLEKLNLAATTVTEADLVPLRSNSSLRKVYLFQAGAALSLRPAGSFPPSSTGTP